MYNIIDHNIYECPVEALSNILGKKWVAVIIWAIQNKNVRFGDLQRTIEGCSKKMLIQQLELLIQNQIIINEKKIISNKVQSIYHLSDSGLLLLPIMKEMIDWSNNNLRCNE